MMTHTKASRLVLGLLALTPLLAAAPAYATGTAAGISIANRATVNYTVGAVAQPAIGSSPTGNSSGAGSDTTFLVDNKIDLNLIETNGAPANTAPGLTTTGTANSVAVYKLTNAGNNPQGYTFGVTQPVGGTLFHTDTFDMLNTRAVVSGAACSSASTTTPTYNSATDTATSVASLNEDACVYVIVLGDTPNGLPNGAAAIVRLTATAVAANTLAALTQTAGADTPGVVDIVFADSAVGVHVAQIARDGKAFDDDEYYVVAPALTVTKTSAVISDPFNLLVNPKAIPGATMEYTITVVNAAAGAQATGVVIADVVPANTTYLPGSILLNAVAVSDATGFTGGATPTVSVNAGALNAGATDTLKFRVTIN
jgi:uncharacterized repeat protein (TIGR01451 family)